MKWYSLEAVHGNVCLAQALSVQDGKTPTWPLRQSGRELRIHLQLLLGRVTKLKTARRDTYARMVVNTSRADLLSAELATSEQN